MARRNLRSMAKTGRRRHEPSDRVSAKRLPAKESPLPKSLTAYTLAVLLEACPDCVAVVGVQCLTDAIGLGPRRSTPHAGRVRLARLSTASHQ